jgi:CelD/BcsL family acetyltransferase involved in cellulose biosynthesis
MMSAVSRITNLEEFIKIKKDWNALLLASKQNTIFLTHEWLTSWWKAFSGKKTSVPMMADKEGLSFIASKEVTDYCDFVFKEDREQAFFEGILSFFRSNYPRKTQFKFINIPSSSPTLSYLSRLAPHFGISFSAEISEVCPSLELPDTYDKYVLGLRRKYRHELRRKLRRTESLEGLEFKKSTEISELQELIPRFIDLHKKSSLGKKRFWEKEGMADFFSDVIHRFSLNEWVEIISLYHKEELLAVLISFIYSDGVSFYNVAFNTKYAEYNPGVYLFNQALEDAILRKIKRADFLRGDEKYKYNFGAKGCKIYDSLLLVGDKKE